MFGALVDYWYYTGDSQYNAITTQALLHQVGPDNNYMPPNQSRTLGNDDQGFWGMAALSAAEDKFPDPPADKPQWLALAQAVFNSQAIRWNNASCGGGLKWQIFTFNNGYTYKNTISNGVFFNMAARLAMYTGNSTYALWAETTWDWLTAVGLLSPSYQFFDGTDDTENCTTINHIQWTYNSGVFLLGAANMYNFTKGSEKWKTRLEGIISGSEVFFSKEPPNVMTEVACESNGKCNVDQRSFKAYLSRWMAATTKVAPFTFEILMPKLQASAQAAALQCSGPSNACGLRWTKGAEYDGSTGVGEQMAALEVFQSLLSPDSPGPANNVTGTSKGDPSAGTAPDKESIVPPSEITTGDKIGAGFMTTLILLGVLGGAWWMVS